MSFIAHLPAKPDVRVGSILLKKSIEVTDQIFPRRGSVFRSRTRRVASPSADATQVALNRIVSTMKVECRSPSELRCFSPLQCFGLLQQNRSFASVLLSAFGGTADMLSRVKVAMGHNPTHASQQNHLRSRDCRPPSHQFERGQPHQPEGRAGAVRFAMRSSCNVLIGAGDQNAGSARTPP